MSELFASISGHRATSLRLYVPNVGAWFVDAELDEALELAGKVEVRLGSLTLLGTVDPRHTGTFVTHTVVRVLAGGGGWSRELAAKSYHNDAGVRAATVCEDAAREAGEAIGEPFAPPLAALGVDYVRRTGPAAHVLADVLGAVPWWVGYDGKTRAGSRPEVTPEKGALELLYFDPATKLAVISADDPAAIGIGTVLTDAERLPVPETVRELELVATTGALRVTAWCGGDAMTPGRIARSLAAFVRAVSGKVFGKYRYRVVTMAPDGRVKVQAVKKARGLPDVVPVSVRPGVAGAWADLTLGCEVLLEFIAGDPTEPIVTGFPGRGEAGFLPGRLTLGATTPGDASDAARKGDTVKVLLPPAVFSGSIGGAPATGVITFPTGYTLGSVTTGSAKVGIGT
jgi:hypothetical protein